MPYILIAVLLTGFASGYGVSSALSKADIQQMAEGIAAQNREAELTLARLNEIAETAQTQAVKLTKDLEVAHEASIKSINTNRSLLKSQRLFDNGRTSRGCTPAQGGGTNAPVDPADDRGLSEEFADFLKSEAFRADEVSAYADLCKRFVVDTNCGVPR